MSKGKFLIVEDEFVVAENLRVELESMGYEIVGLGLWGDQKPCEFSRNSAQPNDKFSIYTLKKALLFQYH
jgi:hypothetical protein